MRWTSTNLAGVPAPVPGSLVFNARPQPLHMAGTRATHPGLFALLARCGDAAGSCAVFAHDMQRSFGLVAAFHHAPLQPFPSPAWICDLEEKSGGRWSNNSIWQPLDLLFEFCQWMLARFALPCGGPCVTPWRGSTRVDATKNNLTLNTAAVLDTPVTA